MLFRYIIMYYLTDRPMINQRKLSRFLNITPNDKTWLCLGPNQGLVISILNYLIKLMMSLMAIAIKSSSRVRLSFWNRKKCILDNIRRFKCWKWSHCRGNSERSLEIKLVLVPVSFDELTEDGISSKKKVHLGKTQKLNSETYSNFPTWNLRKHTYCGTLHNVSNKHVGWNKHVGEQFTLKTKCLGTPLRLWACRKSTPSTPKVKCLEILLRHCWDTSDGFSRRNVNLI